MEADSTTLVRLCQLFWLLEAAAEQACLHNVGHSCGRQQHDTHSNMSPNILTLQRQNFHARQAGDGWAYLQGKGASGLSACCASVQDQVHRYLTAHACRVRLQLWREPVRCHPSRHGAQQLVLPAGGDASCVGAAGTAQISEANAARWGSVSFALPAG